MSGKRIARGFAAKRISDLPNHLVDDILKYLPLKDAVRTSILSTEWRNKWVTIPYLDFTEGFEKSSRGEPNVEQIINHVLALHRGSIVKFKFNQQKRDIGIDKWFHLLENHPIEELTLEFLFMSSQNLVDQHVFTFEGLRHLYLKNADVKFPSTFKGLPKLIKLELDGVEIAPECFEILVSKKCPMLEILSVIKCTTPLRLMIDVPNLKSFEFEGEFSSIFFANPRMEEICIDGCDFSMPMPESLGNESNLIKVFDQLSSIKRLKSDDHFLQFLTIGDVPQELPISLNHMTKMEFSCVDFLNQDVVACVVCLLRSSPNLQSLEIRCLPSTEDLTSLEAIQYMRRQHKVERPLSRSLKSIKINWFSGFIIEMEFLKLLLLGAVALKKMTIGNPSIYAAPLAELHMVKVLASFHLASPDVMIVVDCREGVQYSF